MFGDRFGNPEFLWLLLLIPLATAYWWWKTSKHTTDVQFSSLLPFKAKMRTLREQLHQAPLVLRLLAVGIFLIALARPQSVSARQNMTTEGIDIVLVLDISRSMLAEDFTPNRIVAAKQVADEFVQGRTNDRIGLVIFSGESFTQCPLTTDYTVLRNLLREVKEGMIVDGTAIGLALANGAGRLRDSKAKSKVMILLTDGVNNRGEIDPLTGAKLAATYGVRVYTVGVGTQGEAPYPFPTPYGVRRQMIPVDLDEKMLEQVAAMTGGKYFRATDNRKLRAIYKEIDQLEKTKIEVTAYKKYTDLFPLWLMAGCIVALVEIGLSTTVLRKIP